MDIQFHSSTYAVVTFKKGVCMFFFCLLIHTHIVAYFSCLKIFSFHIIFLHLSAMLHLNVFSLLRCDTPDSDFNFKKISEQKESGGNWMDLNLSAWWQQMHAAWKCAIKTQLKSQLNLKVNWWIYFTHTGRIREYSQLFPQSESECNFSRRRKHLSLST